MRLNIVSIILTGFIIVVSFVMTYFLTFTNLMIEDLSGNKRTAFIFVLLVYGIYRSYRLYLMIKKKQ
jgi:hypothetical protein